MCVAGFFLAQEYGIYIASIAPSAASRDKKSVKRSTEELHTKDLDA